MTLKRKSWNLKIKKMNESLQVLKQIEVKYKELLEWGYNKPDAGERCVNEISNAPYVYKDEFKAPLYCMRGEYVFIFDDGIYKKID